MTGFVVIDAFIAALIGIFRVFKWMFEGLMFLMSAILVGLLIWMAYQKIRRSEK